MLVNNQLAAGEYRHNYIRLAFVLGAVLLFIGYVAVYQLFERGSNCKLTSGLNLVEFVMKCFQMLIKMVHFAPKICS